MMSAFDQFNASIGVVSIGEYENKESHGAKRW